MAMSSESLISVRCADFCFQKLEAVGGIFTPSLTSTCWHVPSLGSGGVGSGGADSPGGTGGARCAFLPHRKKFDLPQLIDRILLP